MLLATYFADTALLDCGLVRENPSRVAAFLFAPAFNSMFTAASCPSNEATWRAVAPAWMAYGERERVVMFT